MIFTVGLILIVMYCSGFLSNRVQRVVIDRIRSENVRVVAGVPHGRVLGS